AEIASMEPSIEHRRLSGLRTVPVTFHHQRPAQRNLAGRWLAIVALLRLWVRSRRQDFCLYSLQRSSYRTDHVVVWGIGEHGRRRLCQSVSLQHVNPQRVEVACDVRIEAGSAADEVTHLPAPRVVHFADKEWS